MGGGIGSALRRLGVRVDQFHAIHETVAAKRNHITAVQLARVLLEALAAVRAVGSALNRNPVPLLVPCHRVTRSDGHLGDYAYGVEMKRDLLAVEGLDPGVERRDRPIRLAAAPLLLSEDDPRTRSEIPPSGSRRTVTPASPRNSSSRLVISRPRSRRRAPAASS